MFATQYDSGLKIWSGNKLSLNFKTNCSIGEEILLALQSNPNAIGQISENNGIQFTNEEIRLKTIRIAQNLTKLGFEMGDIIGIVAQNNHHLAPIVFAAMAIGCPINTLHPEYDRSDIAHMFGITKPKLVFCDLDNAKEVRESLNEIQVSASLYTFDGSTPDSRSVDDFLVETQQETEFKPVQLLDGANHTAAIVCSSGTTGRSKGICLSHAAILNALTSQPFNSNEIIFSFSPIFWITGLLTLLCGTILRATRVITIHPFSPELFLRIIEEYRINSLVTPPHILGLTLSHENIKTTDLSSLRVYGCGGSMVAEELSNQMQKYLPNGTLCVGYGISEIPNIVALNQPPKSGAVGLLREGLRVKIVDVNGNQCGVNESGEIRIKIPCIFNGYYDNEEMTRNSFDADGWFMTGDIGHFDEDGYLFHGGRQKDILKYCNHQISPSEIESLLMEHPAVKQVCVVGVPDLICTDLPAAAIVTKDNVQLTADELQHFTEGKLSDYKKLRGGVYFVDSLPMTPSGKCLKRIVKENVIQLFNNNNIANISSK